jgi:surface carbohydrate biosynthesis protein
VFEQRRSEQPGFDQHVPDRHAPHVALVVDHPERDLAGLVLTALELVQRGVVCHLVPMNLQEREIWALAPDFVLFNYLRRSNERFARDLAAAGIAFGVLDTEGAIWPDPDEYASLLWHDVSLLHQARCVCMWGARLGEFLIERNLFTGDQIIVTGCPRFDLYISPWRNLFEDAADPHGRTKRILINTNFSVSNPKFTTADKCVALHRSVLGYSESELRRIVHAETVAIRETVRIAEQLADTFPSVEIVIRPHPFENASPYEAAAAGRHNLYVRQSESIQAAIFGASAVIQRSCTTAIEAGMAGVPAFSPQWMAAPFLMPDAEAASVPCASLSELTDYLTDVLNGTYRVPEGARQKVAGVIRECCFAADGLSHWRVSEAVFRALHPLPHVDRDQCRRHLYGLGNDGLDHGGNGARDRALTRAARYARHGLRLSPDWSFTRMRDVPAIEWMNGGKHFDVERVRHLVDRSRQLAPFAADADDVIVNRDDRASSGGREHARYGVTLADARLFDVEQRHAS